MHVPPEKGSSSSSIVQIMEHRFLPILISFEDEFRKEFPSIKTSVFSGPVGTLTSYQGYHLGMECYLLGTSPEQPDSVALVIDLMHLNTLPKINSVGVYWVDGSVEMEVISDPIVFSLDIITKIEEKFPKLLDALKKAINRGQDVYVI